MPATSFHRQTPGRALGQSNISFLKILKKSLSSHFCITYTVNENYKSKISLAVQRYQKKNSKAMSPRYQKNSKCASGKKDSKEIAQQLLRRYQKTRRGKHGRSSPNYNFLISCSVSLQSINPICSPRCSACFSFCAHRH